MEQELRIYRPEPNEEGIRWLEEATGADQRVLRNAIMGLNMTSISQIGRAAVVVVQVGDRGRLIIQPPLSGNELEILKRVPSFEAILTEDKLWQEL